MSDNNNCSSEEIERVASLSELTGTLSQRSNEEVQVLMRLLHNSSTSTENKEENSNELLFSNRRDRHVPIPLSDLQRQFHRPIAEAAKNLNCCTTLLKKICRRYSIKRWPYRLLMSLVTTLESVEMTLQNEYIPPDVGEEQQKQKKSIYFMIHTIFVHPDQDHTQDSLRAYIEEGNNVELTYDQQLSVNGIIEQMRKEKQDSHTKIIISSPRSSFLARILSILICVGNNTSVPFPAETLVSTPPPSTPIPFSPDTVDTAISTQATVSTSSHIVLPPLIRKRHRLSKRPIHLVEPDVCNVFKTEVVVCRTALNIPRTFMM